MIWKHVLHGSHEDGDIVFKIEIYVFQFQKKEKEIFWWVGASANTQDSVNRWVCDAVGRHHIIQG